MLPRTLRGALSEATVSSTSVGNTLFARFTYPRLLGVDRLELGAAVVGALQHQPEGGAFASGELTKVHLVTAYRELIANARGAAWARASLDVVGLLEGAGPEREWTISHLPEDLTVFKSTRLDIFQGYLEAPVQVIREERGADFKELNSHRDELVDAPSARSSTCSTQTWIGSRGYCLPGLSDAAWRWSHRGSRNAACPILRTGERRSVLRTSLRPA